MSNLFAFEQLLGPLPNCELFPTKDVLPNGISYIRDEMPGFIPRSLSIKEPGDSGVPPVIIISAPGAVGKSTLGQAIAWNKKALFWDLAKGDEVGGASFDGMILNTLEGGNTEHFFEWMSSGLMFVIIDALDEGRIKVNENTFRRLLENISSRAQGSQGTCFVLLGRTHIAEEAWLVLKEAGTDAAIYAIEPFNRDQANQYIANKVSSHHSQAFLECRDLIFDQLNQAVGGNLASDSVDFLHYPPVLDVIAKLLERESNPHRLRTEISSGEAKTQGNSADLLQQVIVSILHREQEEKLTRNIEPVLKSANSSGEPIGTGSLYGNDEQCTRLLNSVLNVNVVATPESLPEMVRASYESAVGTFLPEHPFLQGIDRFANTVFQSYLYAWALKGHYGSQIKQLVTQELLKREHLPTRLLADFYFTGTPLNSNGPVEIHPSHLGLLYDSLISSESTHSRVRLNVDGPDAIDFEADEDELVGGEFEIWSDFGNEMVPRPIPFTLQLNEDSVLSFSRSIRDASLIVPCTVELGDSDLEFQLGPSVYINSNTIRLKSNSLIVRGESILPADREPNDLVQLEARHFESVGLNGPPAITVYTPETFHVAWPEAEQFPWNPYRLERSHVLSHFDDAMNHVYRRFKRIAVEFRSHSRGGLARSRQKIDTRRVLKGEVGRALLGRLTDDGILMLREGGSRYFWNPTEADRLLGVTWIDLRQGQIPDALREYLSDFIVRNSELF